MHEIIEQYIKEISEHQEAIEKRKKAIEALQDLCNHKMQHTGNDSHYHYYKCTICGKTDKE